MKDVNDKQTADLFNKRGRGRPATGCAQSDADRARAYRLRKKQQIFPLQQAIQYADCDDLAHQVATLQAQIELLTLQNKHLADDKRGLLARISSLEISSKVLSTRLKNSNDSLNTHKKLLDRAESELRKHVPGWN